MSSIYRVSPVGKFPVLRHYSNAARASIRAAAEFPESVSSVERVSVEALGAMQEGEALVSPVARRVIARHLEAQRKRWKRLAKVRAAATRREKKREEEREAQREAGRMKTEAAKKARAAAKSAATRAKKKAEKAAAEATAAPPIALGAPALHEREEDIDESSWDSDSAPW